MSFVPGFVSEFPDNPVTDCVPATGLMEVNKVTHNQYPSSIAEREALQNAMGTQDRGATTQQLKAGIKKLFGLDLPIVNGWSQIAAALAYGNKAASLQGQYQKLPSWLRNQGNQPGFNGLHEIYAQGDGSHTNIIIGDPLASHYYPAVSISTVMDYVNSGDGTSLIATEQSATIVGYRIYFTPGKYTLFKVTRWTHILYGARTVTFGNTWAPVEHGSPGFWMWKSGYYLGYYAVYGKTGGFTIKALYSDGNMKVVSSAS